MSDEEFKLMSRRFRGYYPVVVDVETGGFDDKKDALLENGDIMPQGVDASKLVPHLVACIKGLVARVEALEQAA